MQRMVKVLIFICLFILYADGAFADLYTTTDGVANRSINGGYWNGDAFLLNGAEVFCLERIEYISLPGTYFGEISESAISGGISGGNPDPLDSETAWLYTQYLNNVYAHDAAGKIAMQLAIWKLEGELDNFYPYSFVDASYFRGYFRRRGHWRGKHQHGKSK
jgi:hypothetical protein